MESLLFMLNSIVMVLLIFMSLRDERRPPGDPHTSFFRMTPDGRQAGAAPEPTFVADAAPWADWTPAEQAGATLGPPFGEGPRR